MEAVTQQFYESVCWAFYSFAFGVFLREFAPSTFGRWLGRVGVLCAMLVLVLFGDYSIRQCSLLAMNSKVMNGEGISHAKRKDKSTSEVPEIDRQIRTPAGHVVTVKLDANPDRSMSGATDSTEWGVDGRGLGDRGTRLGITDCRGTTGSPRRLPVVSPSLDEWK